MSEMCEHCGWLVIDGGEQQKYEEIKRMAWEIYQKIYITALTNNEAGTEKHLQIIMKAAWARAEAFYNYAKEKEEGANDD